MSERKGRPLAHARGHTCSETALASIVHCDATPPSRFHGFALAASLFPVCSPPKSFRASMILGPVETGASGALGVFTAYLPLASRSARGEESPLSRITLQNGIEVSGAARSPKTISPYALGLSGSKMCRSAYSPARLIPQPLSTGAPVDSRRSRRSETGVT